MRDSPTSPSIDLLSRFSLKAKLVPKKHSTLRLVCRQDEEFSFISTALKRFLTPQIHHIKPMILLKITTLVITALFVFITLFLNKRPILFLISVFFNLFLIFIYLNNVADDLGLILIYVIVLSVCFFLVLVLGHLQVDVEKLKHYTRTVDAWLMKTLSINLRTVMFCVFLLFSFALILKIAVII